MRRLATVLGVVVVLTACGGSGASSKSPASSASASPATTPSSSSATTTTFKPALVGHGNVFFVSPSNNIGCALSETAVRCDIKDRTWSPPAKPATCDLDFGQGLTIVGTSPATLTCAGDTVLVGETVLPYGSAASRGDFECRSEEAGMRCRNVRTGHGFSLARENFTLG